MSQKSAITLTIGGRAFISHLYSSSQAFEILLTLGEVLAGPLSKLLDREVSSDLSEIASAVDELQDKAPTVGAVLGLFGSLRKTGGADLVVQILKTTYFEDRAIDSRKRFDEVFQGPAGLVDAAQLTWRVLVYQLGPLWDALRPLLSGVQGGALTDLWGTRLNSARMSTGGSGVQ